MFSKGKKALREQGKGARVTGLPQKGCKNKRLKGILQCHDVYSCLRLHKSEVTNIRLFADALFRPAYPLIFTKLEVVYEFKRDVGRLARRDKNYAF